MLLCIDIQFQNDSFLLLRNIVKIAISSRTLESESVLKVCSHLLHKKTLLIKSCEI
jgi:hypothetical protein